MSVVRKPFTLALLGTSLTTGRLSADWAPRLNRELPAQPEGVGPIRVYNLGKGSQNSAWGLSQAPLLTGLKPTHILFEGFAINDCIDFGGGPAVTRAAHIQNIKDMIDAWQAGIPGVDLTLQTMSTIAAAITGTRPNYADYVADEIATAALKGIRCLNNYAGWPNPLDPMLTDGRVFFAQEVPAGYVGWSSVGAFDPAAKAAAITLSNGNLTLASSALHSGVRGTAGRAAGKYYFEVAVSGPQGTTIGIATAASNFGYIGNDAAGYGYYDTGAVITGGVSTGGYATFGAGAVIGVAVDLTAAKIWWSRNGAWQNGDPAAGTGGRAITPATYYPAVSASAGGGATGRFDVTLGDGLHPVGPGAVDVYHYPNVLAWARARMAEHWGL